MKKVLIFFIMIFVIFSISSCSNQEWRDVSLNYFSRQESAVGKTHYSHFSFLEAFPSLKPSSWVGNSGEARSCCILQENQNKVLIGFEIETHREFLEAGGMWISQVELMGTILHITISYHSANYLQWMEGFTRVPFILELNKNLYDQAQSFYVKMLDRR